MGKTKELALVEQEGKTVFKKNTNSQTRQFILVSPEWRDKLVAYLETRPMSEAAELYTAFKNAKPAEITINNE